MRNEEADSIYFLVLVPFAHFLVPRSSFLCS